MIKKIRKEMSREAVKAKDFSRCDKGAEQFTDDK
jgi:hypothetical protein